MIWRLVVPILAAIVLWQGFAWLNCPTRANNGEGASALKVSVPTLSSDQPWLQARLKVLFDYYILTYQGDEVAMQAAFKQNCAELTQCQNINELFQRYLTYKKSLVSAANSKDDGQLANTLVQLNELRASHFSEQELLVLFPEQGEWQQAALERQKIRQDQALTSKQKQQRLVNHLQESTNLETAKSSLTLAQVIALSEQGQLTDDNYQILATQFGQQVARRLIATTEQQSLWLQKVEQYQQQVEQLKQQYHLDSEQYLSRVNKLEVDMFSPNERKRLAVISALTN